MACTTSIKDTDVLLLLLLGLLPLALVSGQTNGSTLIPSVSATMTNTASTMAMSPNSASPTTAASASSASSAASATSGSSGAATTQSATSMTTIAMSAPPTTVATSGSVSSTNSGTTSATAVSPASSAAVSPTMTQTSTMAASGSTVSSSAAASTSGSPTSSVSSSAATMTTAMTSGAQTSGNTTGVTSGTTNTTSMNMMQICCPSFTCNYTDCYSMSTSQNDTKCDAGVSYCQLIKQSGMRYIASCSASCADSCVNETQTNCSVECCNSTGCLNATFASMMMTTTVTPATTTTAPVTTTKATTTPQTTANNGNKCRAATCNDNADCYTGFSTAPIQTCSSSHLHCQLKKETVDSKVKWTAGCTTNCSGQTWCKSSSSSPPCHLECCNATKTSCLWLNGTANVPSLATRGPHLHIELIVLLVCLLGISSFI